MKRYLSMVLILVTLSLTACGSVSKGSQSGLSSSEGQLPTATLLLVGTMKLDGTEQDVTADQAAELLPLWQVYNELLTSDTAAQEVIDGLVNQIKETMTGEQMQTISDMSLTQQDVFTLMRENGSGFVQSSSDGAGITTQDNDGFSGPPGGGGGMPMGAPPAGGGMPGGMAPDGQQSSGGGEGAVAETGRGPMGGGVPSALIEALIEMLKSKAGS